MSATSELNELRSALLSDFLLYERVMFEYRTGRKFMMSQPEGNESHFVTLARAFVDVILLKTTHLIINMPPGWGKSEFCRSFLSWATALFPDAKSLYLSYSFDLASSHTAEIKHTMMLPIYKRLFDVNIRRDSSAKDFFKTEQGGAIKAFGSGGAVTGHDAGLPGLNRFSGALVIDDICKPDDVHSALIRANIRRNYFETIQQRPRAPNVPIIFVGQRLHEDDMCSTLLKGEDGNQWTQLIISGLDVHDNALYPEVSPKAKLIRMREKQPYVYYSQYQQRPTPSGGALYKPHDFDLLYEIPQILETFITCDTAETEQTYNDATVFSFWGLYELRVKDIELGAYALFWLDCREIRVEPRDLEDQFIDFYAKCMTFRVKPKIATIEKKSTGVTLASVLKKTHGLQIIPIDRNFTSGSKTARFLKMQPYIASHLVSLPAYAVHTQMCLDHMLKITANETHAHDDIADTCYDAVKIALIDQTISRRIITQTDYSAIAAAMGRSNARLEQIRNQAHGR